MNKNILIIGAMICLLTMTAGCCRKSNDLLANGGFEPQSDLQKSPVDWYATVLPDTKEFVDFEWDDQVVHTGKRSVSIAIDPAHPAERIDYNWTAVVPGYQVGATYEVSGWVKGENLNGATWIVAQCWDERMSEMLEFATTQKDYPLTGTFDWTQVGTVFTVPEGTEEVRIRAGLSSPDCRGGRIWYDDIGVREIP